MAGSRALRKLQIGREATATPGTPVAATTIWRGMGTIKDNREVVFPDEDVGILGGTDRSYIASKSSELTMSAVESTFEQIPYIFEAGIKQVQTGSVDTGGSGYIYNYTSPTTAQNTHGTYTIEGGDDQQAEEFDYAFVKSFNLSGDGMGALFVTADWFGRETTNSTFENVNIPTVEEILVNNAVLYIDDSGGTIGNTTASSTLFGIDLSWDTGINEYWAADGSLDFSLTKFTEDEIMLNLTYEHNGTAVLEKAEYRAGNTRLIRLLFEGSTLTTEGATYANKSMIVDLAGVYEDWSVLEDQDGNDVVTAALRVRYSGTDTLKADVTVVNELANLA